MLDGIQNHELKTFLAVRGKGEHGDKSVTFQAADKRAARRMLDENDMGDYRIVWMSTPKTIHKKV